MDRPYFFNELRNIYAIHGKNLTDNAVVSAIFHAVENFPNAFMEFATEKISDYTSLPSNLGRELRCELWPVFLEKFPQYKAQEQSRCHECAPDLAGWFWAYGPDMQRKVFKCACNRQRQFEHVSGYTHSAVVRQGYEVINWQEDYARQVLAGMGGQGSKSVPLQTVTGKNADVDIRRVRHLPDGERARYEQAV